MMRAKEAEKSCTYLQDLYVQNFDKIPQVPHRAGGSKIEASADFPIGGGKRAWTQRRG
jgi:hypothetical protein